MLDRIKYTIRTWVNTYRYARLLRSCSAADGWESRWLAHRDRAGVVDVWYKYGRNQTTARRDPITLHDIEADDVNANVRIASRAISDAVKSLPLRVYETEVVDGVERRYPDADHPLNDWLKAPNSEHDITELVVHMVKCYLLDGNDYLTIEKNTGPNLKIETWPRDPRNVEVIIRGGQHAGFKIGKGREARTYPRDRVVHIRDIDPKRPFYGISRIQPVRDEIAMDYYINQFNSNFFINGATLNLMFTPKKELTIPQHKMLVNAFNKEITGVDMAFSVFINKYPGEFTHPDVKHKDIAFGELLRMNREKIFGAFGLPPFRGGVMEYANYANALAQDVDFWNNTVKPVTMTLEAALNRQFVGRWFSDGVTLAFDYSDVPALRGDPKEQAEVHRIYVDAGVMTQNEVREELGKEPLPGQETRPPGDGDTKDEPEPSDEDEKDTENILRATFKRQRMTVEGGFGALTDNGRNMWVITDPTIQVKRLFNLPDENDGYVTDMGSRLKYRLLTICNRMNNGNGPFDPEKVAAVFAMMHIERRIRDMNRETNAMLLSILKNTDAGGWTYGETVKKMRSLFTRDRAHRVAIEITKTMTTDAARMMRGREV